jgi:uncharacterized protein
MRVAFAGSTIGSFWYEAALLLQKATARYGVEMDIDTHTTDFNNVLAVGRKEKDLGVTLPLFLDLAQRRTSVYANEPLADLRVIAALNKPTWLAAAVDRASGITTLREITERRYPWRVALPPRDNLAGVYIDKILNGHGITRDALSAWGGAEFHPTAIGPRDDDGPWPMRTITPELGRNGTVNGFFMYVSWVSAWARDLTTFLDLRFIAFDEAVLDDVIAGEGGGVKLTLPEGLFPGSERDLPAAGWRHEYVYGTVDTPDELVDVILRSLEDERILDNAHGFSHAAFHPPALPGGLRLHQAAERYYARRATLAAT